MNDRLARIARLRALQLAAARLNLADRTGAARQAEDATRVCADAVRQEAAYGDPAAFAAWLPAGRAALAAASAIRARRDADATQARAELAAARAQAEAVAVLRHAAARARAAMLARRTEAELDNRAAATCAGSPGGATDTDEPLCSSVSARGVGGAAARETKTHTGEPIFP